MSQQTIVEQLWRVRRGHLYKLSQRDVAAKAKLSLDRYWRIENGVTTPTEEEAGRIAKALNVKLGDLGFTTFALVKV